MCFNQNMCRDVKVSHGFWLHMIAALFIFFIGMRFGFRRAPFSMLAYRFIRMLVRG